MARLAADGVSLTVTLVIFGPSRSGKSSLLRGVHDRLGDGPGTVRMADATPFSPLDWLAIDLGVIGGRNATVHLYAVPGLAAYDSTRRLLLSQADGVVFLADSQGSRLEANLDALRQLQDHVLAREGDMRELPMVFLYTKQDLPSDLVLPLAALDEALNFRNAPSFTGDALRGAGVREALQAALTLVLRRLAVTAEPPDVAGVGAG